MNVSVVLFPVDENGGLVALLLDRADLAEVSGQLVFGRLGRNSDDFDSV